MKEKIQLITQDVNITWDNFAVIGKISTEYDDITDCIKRSIDDIFENFINIAANLHKVKKLELYKFVGYKDIYDYALNEFDLVSTTVKNLIGIADKFCIHNDDEVVNQLKDEYKDFGYSQLVELISVPEIDLINYKPSMTVRQIRENKCLDRLNNFFNSQLESDTSLLKLCSEYINTNYLNEFNLNFKTNKEEYSYETTYSVSYFSSKKCLFSLDFSYYKRYSDLSMRINPHDYYFIENWGYMNFNDFEEFKKIIDDCFDKYRRLNLEKKNNDYKTKNDLINDEEILSFEDFKNKYSMYGFVEIIDKINDYIDMKQYKFSYKDRIAKCIIDQDKSITFEQIWGDTLIKFCINNQIIKSFDTTDLIHYIFSNQNIVNEYFSQMSD